jgi:hypothetical protein
MSSSTCVGNTISTEPWIRVALVLFLPFEQIPLAVSSAGPSEIAAATRSKKVRRRQ